MTEERNLYYTGQPTPLQVQCVREAKTELDPGFFVRMTRSEGTDAPLLAFQWPDRLPPEPFAYVRTVDTTARMRVALAELWGLTEGVHLTSMSRWLSNALGVEVTEVTE